MAKSARLVTEKRSTARKKRRKETAKEMNKETLLPWKKLKIMASRGKSKMAKRVMAPIPGGTFTIRKIRQEVRVIRETILIGRRNL